MRSDADNRVASEERHVRIVALPERDIGTILLIGIVKKNAIMMLDGH